MKYSGAYGVVLALHLLTVAFLVGPAAMAAAASPRLIRAGQADGLRAAARTTRIFARATLATVVLGAAMVGLGDVGDQWEMTQAWILGSVVLWVVAVGLTEGVVVPAQEAAAEALDGGQPTSGPATRIAAGAGLTMLLWAAIVALMVFKPGL